MLEKQGNANIFYTYCYCSVEGKCAKYIHIHL